MKISTKPLVAMGLAIFLYIVYVTGPEKIIKTFLSVDIKFLIISSLFIAPNVLIKAFRWKRIIKFFKFDYPLKQATKTWLIGLGLSSITPGHIGDFIRSFYLSRKTKMTTSKSFSTVAIDRLFDIIALVALSILGVLILFFFFNISYSFILVVFMLLIVSAIFLASSKKAIIFFLRPIHRYLVPKKLKTKIKNNFEDFYYGFNIIRSPKKLLPLLSMSVLSWIISITEAYFILRALNTEAPFLFLLATLPIEVLVSTIPITFSGFGLRELTLIFFLSMIGIPSETVVAFSLISIFFVWLTAFIGFVFWLKDPIEIKL